MHEAEPYGHLMVNGHPVTDDQLALLTGVPSDQIAAIKGELERAGVYSRNRAGTLYSRRMTRDRKRANVGRKFAKNRWNSANSDAADIIDIPQQNPPPNSSPNAPPITQNPEPSRSVNTSDSRPKARKRVSYTDEFQTFWEGYPTDANMSKKQAFAEWQHVDDESRTKAIKSLPGFNRYCRKNPDYRPVHACRYLKYERYDGHLEGAEEMRRAQNMVEIRKGTPPFEAWNEYRRRQGKPPIPGQSWQVPSEWPPGSSEQAA